MTEIARLQELLERTYSGTCFHGDSIREVLQDIDAAQAIWLPEDGSHSIWQIVEHMAGWLDVIRRRLTSPTLVTMPDEKNFPATPQGSHENWNATLDSFQATLKALIEAVGNFPESRLEAKVPGKEYTFDVLLHGAVHHNLYHLGQIAMMKAMYKRRLSAAA
jgi:uncharacterized damage-inducible protein DinB